MACVSRWIVGVFAAWLLGIAPSQRPARRASLFIDAFDVEEVASLAPGAVLQFSVFASPGASATVLIEGVRRLVELREVQPGVYEGTLRHRGRRSPPCRHHGGGDRLARRRGGPRHARGVAAPRRRAAEHRSAAPARPAAPAPGACARRRAARRAAGDRRAAAGRTPGRLSRLRRGRVDPRGRGADRPGLCRRGRRRHRRRAVRRADRQGARAPRDQRSSAPSAAPCSATRSSARPPAAPGTTRRCACRTVRCGCGATTRRRRSGWVSSSASTPSAGAAPSL